MNKTATHLRLYGRQTADYNNIKTLVPSEILWSQEICFIGEAQIFDQLHLLRALRLKVAIYFFSYHLSSMN